MLTHLHIRNFAIMDSIEIDLSRGLTVLTGETGAGKSIIVDALQLALGGRAGADAIRHGAERAEISATFDLEGAPAALRELLQQQSIEAEEELVVRRVLTREGKSRAFINSHQVTLQVLRDLGAMLVEIHGQHEFQSLTRATAQRGLLDTFAGAGELVRLVAERHAVCTHIHEQLTALEAAARDRESRLDVLRFQTRELQALNAQPAEAASLAEERVRLGHREKLAAAARLAGGAVYHDDEANAHSLVGRAAAALRGASAIDARLAPVYTALQSTLAGLADAGRELSAYLDTLEVDPGRQEAVEQRLASLETAARKHRVSPEELPAKSAELATELARLESSDARLDLLRKHATAAQADWLAAALLLSAQRIPAAAKLSAAISARMQTLGMPGGRFVVVVTRAPTANSAVSSANGVDEIEFQVTANPGQPPQPVARVASGGELSRLSLAVQVTSAATQLGPRGTDPRCLIFDEVDAGIGGGIAEIVGRELAALGKRAQVLCVTHLAQVAAQAAHHLRVSKIAGSGTTRTEINLLTDDARTQEIARMLGGVSITEKAREHAAEMLRKPATGRGKAR